MIIDFYICYSIPSLKRICIGILIYAILYSAFTVIWQWGAGWAIYPFTDWMNDTQWTAIVIVILIVVSQIISVILWWTKRILIGKCSREREKVRRMRSNSMEMLET